jgi:uncharacterized protein VirK/YbjX
LLSFIIVSGGKDCAVEDESALGQAGPVASRSRNAVQHHLIGAVLGGFRAEAGTYNLGARILRTMRRSRIVGHVREVKGLSANPAFEGHLRTDPVHDPLFYLSHQHYLARGLTNDDRILAAKAHYAHETAAFDARYIAQVYRGDGLVLWSSTREDVTYEIRLLPGNDVLYEGGVSLVLFVDGVRVCVLSYTIVPSVVMVPTWHSPELIFVSRLQLTHHHGYQTAFNRAFDRCMPGHLCFGALAGVATVLGQDQVLGIDAARSPSWSHSRKDQFCTTYDGFWQSMSGRKVCDLGYEIEIPLHLSSVAEMDAARRKRALRRRSHIDAVQGSTLNVLSSHLRPLNG